MSAIKPARKRGRPRKSTIKKNIVKRTPENDDREILLKLPDFSDTESDNESNSDNTSSDDNCFFTIQETIDDSDSGHISELSPGIQNSHTVNEIMNKLQKYEKIIKNQHDTINSLKKRLGDENILEDVDVSKQIRSTKLFSVNGNKEIVLKSKPNCECLYCRFKVESIPCFIPERYVNGTYYIIDNYVFCSYNCALKYNDLCLKDRGCGKRETLIRNLYQEIFDDDSELAYAEDISNLKSCTGTLTKKQFKKESRLLHKSMKLKFPPIVPLLSEIEVRNKGIKRTVID